jgi:hypothetical protein
MQCSTAPAALRTELGWHLWKADCIKVSMDSIDRNVRANLNRNSYHLLRVDIETAMTFSRIASGSEEGSDKRARNQSNARTAYDSVQHLRKNVSMTQEQEQALDAGLAELRLGLESLGEQF